VLHRPASPPAPEIAINGRFLTQPMTGVQRFATEVLKAIDGLIDSGEWGGLAGRIEILAPPAARDLSLPHIPMRRCGIGGGYFWEQAELPFYARGRLLLNFCGLGPVVTRNQIVVVHDATPMALPGNFTAPFRAAYKFLIPRLCRRALRTATVSEFSRREIGKWYGVDVSNMSVCYVGADHISKVSADSSIIDRLGLAGRKYFLSVGSGNNKNLETVIAAFLKAKLPDTFVVITGVRDSKINAPRRDMATDSVIDAGFVSDPELRALYDHAFAVVAPSRYEGFGLPPVEAMVCGCPAIISDAPAMVEICGDAALQCSADDAEELAHLLRLVHDDPERRAGLIAAGRTRAARFTWQATARVLLDLCLQAADARNYSPSIAAAMPRTGANF
jgi:glycosyltransferase involved in cell wall biosynthesis